MTARMLYEKLETPQDDLSIEEAKETLLVFNTLAMTTPSEFDPGPVLESPVFPVRFPGGNVRLCSGTDEFSLNDRKPLGEAFAQVAKFLDFDHRELRVMRPFIKWAGMQTRYLSVSVEEIASADRVSTKSISSRHREIRTKAHALLR